MTDELAPLIDHTILAPDASLALVQRFCDEARAHHFHAVCTNPVWVRAVGASLHGSGVKSCAVVGFPLGAARADIKALEAAAAVEDGANEIDMVLAIGALKSGADDQVAADIAAVRAACPQAVLKVIIEACLLTDDEKQRACRLAQAAGAEFVKTSTGFSSGGATTADVALMRATVGTGMGVKASGGIRNRGAALAMIAAGASRIGASASLAIIRAAGEGVVGY